MTIQNSISDVDTILMPTPASTAIEIGDLLFNNSGSVAKASAQTDQATEAANQRLFASLFLGVSAEKRLSTETDTRSIVVRTDCIVDATCPSTTWAVGDLVGASENGDGDALLNQQVEKVTDPSLAIGYCVKAGTNITTVRVRLISRYTPGTVRSIFSGSYGDDDAFSLGDSSDFQLLWSTGDASNHAAVIAIGDTSQALHITDVGAKATDWNISAGTHPTVYIHSNTTPATDYLRIGNHDGTSADIDVVGGTTLNFQIAGTSAMVMTATSLTLADAFNVVANTTTGTKIGTAVGQKLGFWNATPIVQPSGAAQAALTDSSGGSGSTIAAVTDTTMSDQSAAINNAHFAIVTLLHAIRTALVNAGIIKGAA